MPVDSTHPEYDAALPAWQRARDVLAGEDAVKAAGQKYLPRLDSQSDEEYAAYVARASFFGATARTLEEYLDLVFRRAPVIAESALAGLSGFLKDCDGWGTSFIRYARSLVAEVLAVGRAGSLVTWDAVSGKPSVSLFRAEAILNWEVERRGGRTELVGLVLKDGDGLRVFRMVADAEVTEGAQGGSARRCVVERWFQMEGAWCIEEHRTLRRDGAPVPFIPFVFHGPRHSRPEPDRLPLADIIAANLDHYRLDADYKHGLHFTALPTAWVSGFDKGSPLRIGSSTAWVSEVAGAAAGFLEFSGAGLGHIERAMEKVERRMALLGARMGISVPAEAVTASEGAVSDSESFGLSSIVASLNESLSRVLMLAAQAGGEMETPGRNGGAFCMNTDLGARPLSGEEINAVVAAWRAGGISRQTMLEWLKRGEVLPDGRSVKQERELIHGVVEK